MKKFLMLSAVLLVLIITGCAQDQVRDQNFPIPYPKYEN